MKRFWFEREERRSRGGISPSLDFRWKTYRPVATKVSVRSRLTVNFRTSKSDFPHVWASRSRATTRSKGARVGATCRHVWVTAVWRYTIGDRSLPVRLPVIRASLIVSHSLSPFVSLSLWLDETEEITCRRWDVRCEIRYERYVANRLVRDNRRIQTNPLIQDCETPCSKETDIICHLWDVICDRE